MPLPALPLVTTIPVGYTPHATLHVNENTAINYLVSDTQAQNKVLATPAAANGAADFRSLVAADLPANGVINALAVGIVAGGVTDNTATYVTVLAAMTAGQVLYFPPGTYLGDLIIPTNGIKIIGASRPYYNAGVLAAGTILVGTIAINGKIGCAVRGLGVDITTLGTKPFLISAGGNGNAWTGTAQHLQVSDVILNGKAADGHGILLEVGTNNEITNVECYNMIHGIAVKASYCNIDGVYAKNIVSSGIIVKSDVSEGDVRGVNINNLIVEVASAANSIGVNLNAADAVFKTYEISISNIFVTGTQNGIVTSQVAGVGTVTSISIANCNLDTTTQSGIYTLVGSDINVVNCTAKSCPINFRNGAATNVRLWNVISVSPGSLDTSGTFAVVFMNSKFSIFGGTPSAQQADGAALTNSVTVGGTTNTIANYTDLTTYANDAAAIRNNFYQLARKQKIIDDALRLYGFLT